MTKLGEKGQDHWAIYGLMSSVINEKGENLNIYDARNAAKLQRALTERAGFGQDRRGGGGGRGQAKWSTGSAPGSTSDSSISRDMCPLTLAGAGDLTSLASTESQASTGSEGGAREGERKMILTFVFLFNPTFSRKESLSWKTEKGILREAEKCRSSAGEVPKQDE